MFGFLKNLLGKPAVPSQNSPAPGHNAPAVQPAPESYPASGAAVARNGYQNGRGVQVPLQAVLSGLPLELQPRIRQPDVGDLSVSIPLEKILPQLSRGSVKISFGELRRAAPLVFASENDRDTMLVPLPLGEILSRINPALLARRRAQRHVEVPPEIRSPFEPAAREAEPIAAPELESEPNGYHVLAAGLGDAPVSAPAQAPAAALPPPPPPLPNPEPVPLPPAPIWPRVEPQAPATPVVPNRASLNSAATPAPPSAPLPASPVVIPPSRARYGVNGHVPAGPNGNSHLPGGAKDAAPLVLGLAVLAEAWPEAVRKELVQAKLVDAKVALPWHAIEQALKKGRVVFTWKQLRSWIIPPVPPALSALDSTALELPLKIVAPLFLAQQRQSQKPQAKVVIEESIPNLFFGFPQPDSGAASSASPPTPADTNFYVWDETADTARVQEAEAKRGPSPGTRFVSKYATPNEVVSRAAALEGVTGAVIALPDGLLVASRLPADLNADTLAAFLPQIFSKVSQSTRELRMGELNNLNFTVGNIPWKIFRVNAIFFAAFGRAGQPLPTAQLAALAAELDHKPK